MGSYLYVLFFLLATFYFNFTYNTAKDSFEDVVIDGQKTRGMRMLAHFLFFAFAYYGVIVPKLLLTKQFDKLKNKHFWFKSLVMVGLIGICGGILDVYEIYNSLESRTDARYLTKILTNIRRLVLYTIPLFLLKYYYDREQNGLYGLTVKGVSFKPYLYMLAIMLPLITAASFLPSFLKQYPTLKPWLVPEAFGLAKWQMVVIYELVYGMDFMFVELMFRGALIIGLVKILGKDAVLPMAVMYGFLHFGKPMGEAISSVFGGYLLGTFAYYSRNIWGGVFIHMGIAYSMEFTAFIQHWWRMSN